MDKLSIIKNWKRWLDRRSGRTVLDLALDDKGFYTLMADGKGGDKKVYLPTVK